MTEWIDLKVRPPEISHDEIVIINKFKWKRIVRFLDTTKHGKQFVDFNDCIIKGFNPTHWMPFPELPEGDQE